ncbi:MAG: transcription antitermination factor NusB [Hornefia sp.]|nr:transcription antitermination factor NusB [Hornefia sp.]
MTRKEAREFLMQTIYQMDISKDFSKKSSTRYIGGKHSGKQKNYCTSLLDKLCMNIEEIDKKIERNSHKWKIERMPKTDISILRLAACEILYMEDIPTAVSINEAVELAKKYGTEDSPKFINAILGSITRE